MRSFISAALCLLPIAFGAAMGCSPSAADPSIVSRIAPQPVATKNETQGPRADSPADECPFAGGITIAGKKRFMYGANLAWFNFGGDFNNGQGVAANHAAIAAEFDTLKNSGVNVVRWWMFEDFHGNGVAWDGNGDPAGVNPGTWADVDDALSIAADRGMYILFTLFSFDNFKNAAVHNLQPIVRDPARRARVANQIIAPVVQHVMNEGLGSRVAGWDVINEPEWATDEFCSQGYGCMNDVNHVSHVDMDAFIGLAVDTIHAAGGTNVSVGAADARALGWWTPNQDLYTTHFYPYHLLYGQGPTFNGKPVLVGEWMADDNFTNNVSGWYQAGFAGALSWSFTDRRGEYSAQAPTATFQRQHLCETSY